MTGAMPRGPAYQLLKKGSHLNPDIVIRPGAGSDEGESKIRCPLCGWRPLPSDLWCCTGGDPAVPGFTGCGTLWNTFATRGRCPGCEHRWRWTKCMACGEWSPHDDWYDEGTRR